MSIIVIPPHTPSRSFFSEVQAQFVASRRDTFNFNRIETEEKREKIGWRYWDDESFYCSLWLKKNRLGNDVSIQNAGLILVNDRKKEVRIDSMLDKEASLTRVDSQESDTVDGNGDEKKSNGASVDCDKKR